MADYNNRPQRIKNAFDHRKLSLVAPCPGVSPKVNSSLSWNIVANNPRCTVWTNDPDDKGDSNDGGKILANLDTDVFMMLMAKLTDIIENAEPGTRDCVENFNYTFYNRKRSDEPVHTSTFWVGKDAEGCIYVSLVAAGKKRPIIKFPLQQSSFHVFKHADGTEWTPAETSKFFARGYVKRLEQMMIHMACNNYVEPPPPKDSNYGGNRGGGNNNSRAQDTSSEDLPF